MSVAPNRTTSLAHAARSKQDVSETTKVPINNLHIWVAARRRKNRLIVRREVVSPTIPITSLYDYNYKVHLAIEPSSKLAVRRNDNRLTIHCRFFAYNHIRLNKHANCTVGIGLVANQDACTTQYLFSQSNAATDPRHGLRVIARPPRAICRHPMQRFCRSLHTRSTGFRDSASCSSPATGHTGVASAKNDPIRKRARKSNDGLFLLL